MSFDKNTRKNGLLLLGSLVFITLLVLCAIALAHTINPSPSNEAVSLTSVIMVGLALVVGLMILLILFYKVTGIADKNQALGLPTGSIRALIAFCLIFIFVCLGVYLYHGLSTSGAAVTAHNVTLQAATDLEKQFGTAVREPIPGPCPAKTEPVKPPNKPDTKGPGPTPNPEPATSETTEKPVTKLTDATKDTTPTPFCQLTDKDKNPLWNITYFPNHIKEGDDFAKQLFTQLATVFVTVIGFYFGSSTAAAGVSTGVTAAGGPANKSTGPVSGGVPAALQEAKSILHDANSDIVRVTNANASAKALDLDITPFDKFLSQSQTALLAIQADFDTLTKAAAKFGTATTDAENTSIASDVLKARDDMKQLAETIKTNADNAESKLKKP